MTALYAAVELARAWHVVLADVGTDARHFVKSKYLRLWRRNAEFAAEAAAAEEHREDAVLSLTTRNVSRWRYSAARRGFDAWRGLLRASMRAYNMELRALRHRAYVNRKSAATCWRAWRREASEERKRRAEQLRRFELVRERTAARGMRGALRWWRGACGQRGQQQRDGQVAHTRSSIAFGWIT